MRLASSAVILSPCSCCFCYGDCSGASDPTFDPKHGIISACKFSDGSATLSETIILGLKSGASAKGVDKKRRRIHPVLRAEYGRFEGANVEGRGIQVKSESFGTILRSFLCSERSYIVTWLRSDAADVRCWNGMHDAVVD